ncbi:MAG TPA: hypothetical protein VH170_05645 [Chthoniobacterales bacterium]|jgi:hypothetical protein|nr:hypothetical protein [Chthoniobacterales bacterium]
MKWAIRAAALFSIALAGCGIGRVVTAPVRYVFHEPEPSPAQNTSDVTNPARPVVAPTPVQRTASRKTTRASAPTTPRVANSKLTKSSAAPQKSSAAVQFPVAKPVPGKAGLVFNPFNASGAYIDVSGYAPGSKVKDPDSQQIFVVP